MIGCQDSRLRLFILGTTAVGKTKLSLALAPLLNAEILGADSMQLYKHADLLTAKASLLEQQVAKHHMIDILQLSECQFNRNKYYQAASESIKQIQSREKNVIVVGGTNYYIESLLFEQQISTCERVDEIKIQHLDKLERYKKLQQLDPLLAKKIHPNDQQRVNNYLRVRLANPRDQTVFDNFDAMRLRHENTLIVWIRCSSFQKLKQRMAFRIKTEMLNTEGLIQILSVLQIAPEEGRGVTQSIGYKQFRALFDRLKDRWSDLSKDTEFPQVSKIIRQALDKKGLSQQDQSIKQACFKELLNNTFQYARRQIKWINRRIVSSAASPLFINRLFVLQFDQFQKAGDMISRFVQAVSKCRGARLAQQLHQNYPQFLPNLKEVERSREKTQLKGPQFWQSKECKQCGKWLRGEQQIEGHFRSWRHERKLKGRKRDGKQQ